MKKEFIAIWRVLLLLFVASSAPAFAQSDGPQESPTQADVPFNLLANGDFEAGAASWSQTSTGGFAIVTNSPSQAHAGSYVAWLGGYNNGVDTLSQLINVPNSAGPVSVRFWYRTISEEGPTTFAFDNMTVTIANASTGTTLATLASYSNLTNAVAWAQSPPLDVSAFKGQTVRLVFRATTDISNLTSFFVDDVSLTAGGRIVNISTRMQVLTGNDVMIAGFIIGGSAAKTVVVNVAGASLANFGIGNYLPDPVLTLYRASDQVVMASNDDWQNQSSSNVSAIQASGFRPNHVLEPAVIATLAPGAYTAVVQGFNGGTGVGLVGVFEVDHPEIPLTNISTRGRVLTGNDVMIAGFVVQGSGTKTVVINVAGPSLANFGIASPLGNPTLTLIRSSDNAVIATNDNWQSQANPSDVAAIQATGFQPNNPAEPAIIATLPPGGYTAIVQGTGGTTGVALVGVFSVP
jgi:hypothetical protein